MRSADVQNHAVVPGDRNLLHLDNDRGSSARGSVRTHVVLRKSALKWESVIQLGDLQRPTSK